MNVKKLGYPANNEIEYRIYEKPINGENKNKKKKESENNSPGGSDSSDGQENIVELVMDRKRSIAESLRRSKEMIYGHARANKWEYFVTYTFNKEKVDRYDYNACFAAMSEHMKNMKRRHCFYLKYILIPDRHKDGAYHFHGLLADMTGFKMTDSGKKHKGKVIWNSKHYKSGWTTLIKLSEGDSAKTANYMVNEYITKDLASETLGKSRYIVSRNLEKREEENFDLTSEEIKLLKEEIKENTTSAKVVKVDTPDYRNTIEYINVNTSLPRLPKKSKVPKKVLARSHKV